MSDAVFPTLPGLAWNVVKTPQWLTKVQQAVSGRETRAGFRQVPTYKFSLTYELLREAAALGELQILVGFFNDRMGSLDNFLYTDPSDHAVSAQAFGTGDGMTQSFQLVRSYGSNAEPVMNLNGTPTVKVAGVVTVPTSIVKGMVTFAAPPALGAALTWSGSFYYRCRFAADVADFENFLYQLWTLKKLELIGSLGSKI